MSTENQLKGLVKQKYGEIALQAKADNVASCCGSGGCSTEVYNIMTDDYIDMKGYVADADLGLGCGLPTQFARIKKGDVVIDLGSGAGNDAFIARSETGEAGKVIGIDFTPAMISKARNNAEMLGYDNVEFREGDIESIPVSDNCADVVVSNCVLNLVPNKEAVLKDVFRILKPGAHFSISDIVLKGELPVNIKEAAEMYAGCVSGAMQKNEYLGLIETLGFEGMIVEKEKKIIVPDDILSQYLDTDQLNSFKEEGIGIYSITVFAQKPINKPQACSGSNCC